MRKEILICDQCHADLTEVVPETWGYIVDLFRRNGLTLEEAIDPYQEPLHFCDRNCLRAYFDRE